MLKVNARIQAFTCVSCSSISFCLGSHVEGTCGELVCVLQATLTVCMSTSACVQYVVFMLVALLADFGWSLCILSLLYSKFCFIPPLPQCFYFPQISVTDSMVSFCSWNVRLDKKFVSPPHSIQNNFLSCSSNQYLIASRQCKMKCVMDHSFAFVPTRNISFWSNIYHSAWMMGTVAVFKRFHMV